MLSPVKFVTGAENEAKWVIPRTLQTETKAVAKLLQFRIIIDIVVDIKSDECPKCRIGHKSMTPTFADAAKAPRK